MTGEFYKNGQTWTIANCAGYGTITRAFVNVFSTMQWSQLILWHVYTKKECFA